MRSPKSLKTIFPQANIKVSHKYCSQKVCGSKGFDLIHVQTGLRAAESRSILLKILS